MTETNVEQDPTMEEILQSIKRIIAEDEDGEQNTQSDEPEESVSEEKREAEDVFEPQEAVAPKPEEAAEPVAQEEPAPSADADLEALDLNETPDDAVSEAVVADESDGMADDDDVLELTDMLTDDGKVVSLKDEGGELLDEIDALAQDLENEPSEIEEADDSADNNNDDSVDDLMASMPTENALDSEASEEVAEPEPEVAVADEPEVSAEDADAASELGESADDEMITDVEDVVLPELEDDDGVDDVIEMAEDSAEDDVIIDVPTEVEMVDEEIADDEAGNIEVVMEDAAEDIMPTENYHADVDITPDVSTESDYLDLEKHLAETGSDVDLDLDEETLLSDATASAATEAMKQLFAAKGSAPDPISGDLPTRQGTTVEDLMVEAMKPLIKQWLDEHLPTTVERIVQDEIRRLVERMGQ